MEKLFYHGQSTSFSVLHTEILLTLKSITEKMPRTMFFYVVLLSPLPQLILSTPISSTETSQGNYSVSTFRCNASPEWDAPTFTPTDCHKAMQIFFRQDLALQGNMPFEFTTRGTLSRSHLIPQGLPRKYTSGDYLSKIDPSPLI